jgi:hypothetical protein
MKKVAAPAASQLAKSGFARLYDVGAGGIIGKALEFDAGHGEQKLAAKKATKLHPGPPSAASACGLARRLVQFRHLGHHKGAAANKDDILGTGSRAGGCHGGRHRPVGPAREALRRGQGS